MHKKLLLLVLIFLSACATNTVISPSYDFTQLKRIGVLAFDSPWDTFKGAENLFAKYFMQSGFTIVERAQLERVLREHNISVSGYMSPETTKMLGKVLGVDVLLTGEISSYSPERTTLTMVERRSTKSEPVYTTNRIKNPDGSISEYTVSSGARVTRSAETQPREVTTNAKVGVIAKLVDVETAEVVWIGSETGYSASSLDAVDGVAKALVKNFKKQVAKQEKLKAEALR